jgi:CheY-like chemotaxis protein
LRETEVPVDPTVQAAIQGLDILIVEDDPDAQVSLCALYEKYGARVICASAADEALRLATTFQYDAMVSDLEMPGHDGLWLMRQLKALTTTGNPAPWAVLLTGSASQGMGTAAIQAGFDVWLKEPVDAEAPARDRPSLRRWFPHVGGRGGKHAIMIEKPRHGSGTSR